MGVGSAARAELFVEVDAPNSGDLVREPMALCEVRGWAGTEQRGEHDVMIVLDRSGSTFRASGVDVDQDGFVGRNVPNAPPELAMVWTSDFGDTIVSAELAAARRLIERFDPATTRMGLVSFGGNASLDAPLGSSREALLTALDRIPPRPNEHGTYIYGALDEAVRAFDSAPDIGPRADVPRGPGEGPKRRRQILLLSDGAPTEPQPPSIAQASSVRAARNAARAGARIHAYALGPAAAARRVQFEEIARASGGELVALDAPADIVDFVPYSSWTELEAIALVNATTGEPGRALRLFPDGSFDGFAPLALGRNELRIEATSSGGARQAVTRWVTFEKTPPDAEKLARFRRLLEIRAVETQLAEKARARRKVVLEKKLEIEPARER